VADALKIALAQINPTVGDVTGNAALIKSARTDAAQLGAELVVFPELVLSGYPPEDLVYRSAFLDAVDTALRDLAALTADGGPAMLVGAPWRDPEHKGEGRHLARNAVLLLCRVPWCSKAFVWG
jgi:NAD+ synthase